MSLTENRRKIDRQIDRQIDRERERERERETDRQIDKQTEVGSIAQLNSVEEVEMKKMEKSF